MSPRSGLTRTTSGYRSLRRAFSNGAPCDASLADLLLTPAPATPYLLFIIFVATLGPFQFGYHLGELNAPEAVITCRAETEPIPSLQSKYFPSCIPMSTVQWGLIQSAFSIGGLVGSLGSGSITTKHGRRPAMMMLTCALALGSAIEASAVSIFSMSLGRAVAGIGAGAATVVCPIFISELSPPQKRGLFGALSQVMINAGILAAQVLGYFFSRESLWRIIPGFPCACSVLTLAALFFAPETPSWLAETGNLHAARAVLRQVRGSDADIKAETQSWTSGSDEEGPLLLGEQTILPEEQDSVSFLDVVIVPQYRKAVIAVTTAFAAQQLTGINGVVMYSVSILGSILPSMASLITVMISAVNLSVSLVCTPLPDAIGRRSCMLLSVAGMGVSSAMLALGLSGDRPSLTVISLFTFVGSFAVGLGPVPFILVGEVAGPEAVGALSSWALAGSWISAFCVAQFFPMLNHILPHGQIFWVFAAIAVVFGTLIAWNVPETRGRTSPEEIWKSP